MGARQPRERTVGPLMGESALTVAGASLKCSVGCPGELGGASTCLCTCKFHHARCGPSPGAALARAMLLLQPEARDAGVFGLRR